MKTETPNNSNKPSSGAQNSKANNTRITVKSAVLNYLKSGRTLTSNEALLMFGTSRLGAVIHDLRKKGYAIRTDIIEVKAGTGKPTAHDAHVASYSMIGGE
jgi:hypothetical protein